MDRAKRQLMVTVGTFDGVHRGHIALLRQLKHEAAIAAMQPAVVTFSHHPLALIDPARCPGRLTTEAEHLELLRHIVDHVIILDFDSKLRSLTAHQFLQMLRDKYGVAALLLGFNNHIGSDRLGYGEELALTCRSLGIKLIPGRELSIPQLGQVSSSTIRSLIANGDMHAATQLLGHPYPVSGTVEHGKALGRTIGFPTANLSVNEPLKIIPPAGVYAGYVDIERDRHPVMVNVGHRPTVDSPDAPLTIEAHIIDFDHDIYGRQLTLQLIERLRSERHFPSLEALRSQLSDDALAARRIAATCQ